MTLDQLAKDLKLLGDKNRLTIIASLMEKELCVCELVELLQTSQPNVSQHVRKLKDGGFVKESKKGQWVYYTLSLEHKGYLSGLLEYARSVKEPWPADRSLPCCE